MRQPSSFLVFLVVATATITAVSSSVAPPAIAQSGATPANTSVQRVFIPVSVTDASGNPIDDLTQRDFTLLDNQHPQTIATFRSVSGGGLGATAHAVVIVDAINDLSSGELRRQAKEIETYLSSGSGPLAYPLSIAVVSTAGFLESSPSRDRAELEQQLRQLTAGVGVQDCTTDSGTTSSDAAQAPAVTELNNETLDEMEGLEGKRTGHCRRKHFDDSLAALRKVAKEQSSIAGRSILVWVGRGWSVAAIKKHEDWFSILVAATDAVRDAQATLNFISTEDYERTKEFRHVNWTAIDKGAPSQKDGTVADLALPAIARQSGGVVFNKSKDLAKDLKSCLTGADHYYMLAFDPSPAPAKGELRSISVTTSRTGAAVSAPSLYYGEQ